MRPFPVSVADDYYHGKEFRQTVPKAVAADVRRRNSAFRRNPPPHVGGVGGYAS